MGDGDARRSWTKWGELADREYEMAELDELLHQKFALDQHAIVSSADVCGTIIYVNDKFCDISGYSRQELIGRNHRILNSATHPKEFFRDMFHTIGSGQVWNGEICNRAKDGSLYWVTTTIVPYLGADGKPCKYMSVCADLTSHKSNEGRLNSHKQVLDITREGFWMTDSLGNLLEVNSAYEKISGYSADELKTMHVSHLEMNEDAEGINAHIKKIITQGTDRFETRHRHKDGHAIDIEVSVIYLRQTQQFAAFFRDITETKCAQARLRRSLDMLNAAQRLGQLGSWELDLLRDELIWSDEIYRIFELDPAQFRPSYGSFLEAIHPDDRDKVSSAYAKSLEDKQTYDIKHRLKMADGRIKWVHEYCVSDFDAAGKPLRSMGAVQDITAQMLAEETSRIAAVAFETLEAIMITDVNARIVHVNKAFQNITGYAEEEVLGKNPNILSSGRHDKAFYAQMWQQLLSAGSWSGEIWDRRKDGTEYPKLLTTTAAKNASGETIAYVGIFHDISARRQAEQEIYDLVFHDALTRLPNRRLLLDCFRQALDSSARSQHCGAVLFLDLDRFKTINDTLGRNYGDMLLVEVAERVKSCAGEGATVARLGGDEFVVLIESLGATATNALRKVVLVAEKIRAALSVVYRIAGHEWHSSSSIGVCLYSGNAESADVLIKRADIAMCDAKESGRNAVRFFDPLMQQAVETHAEFEADLRSAVFNRQFSMHYQVQMDNDNRPMGAEALLRWLHPTRGMVLPGQFIPIAEECSLIPEIGNWVLDTACNQLAAWSKNELTRNLILAINVSGQQFRMFDFVDKVAAAVVAYSIDPTRLKLELTESVVLKDVGDVVKKMYALKAIGVGLSLDDFGVGYSSLYYLKMLPLDQVKIDQSFVKDIPNNTNDVVMVKTIIDMARNFGLNVIAEGVETEAQLALLKANGCIAYQGYLFSKPVPIEEFEALLGC